MLHMGNFYRRLRHRRNGESDGAQMRTIRVVHDFVEIEYNGTPDEKARLIVAPPAGYRYLCCGSSMQVADRGAYQVWRNIKYTLTFVKEKAGRK